MLFLVSGQVHVYPSWLISHLQKVPFQGKNKMLQRLFQFKRSVTGRKMGSCEQLGAPRAYRRPCRGIRARRHGHTRVRTHIRTRVGASTRAGTHMYAPYAVIRYAREVTGSYKTQHGQQHLTQTRNYLPRGRVCAQAGACRRADGGKGPAGGQV